MRTKAAAFQPMATATASPVPPRIDRKDSARRGPPKSPEKAQYVPGRRSFRLLALLGAS
jgi:hypothetical protein